MMDSKSDAELVSEADEIAIRQYGKSVRGQYAALCSVGLIVAHCPRWTTGATVREVFVLRLDVGIDCGNDLLVADDGSVGSDRYGSIG